MRVLLDTHVFLWFISADARLPRDLQFLISDPANDVYLSAETERGSGFDLIEA